MLNKRLLWLFAPSTLGAALLGSLALTGCTRHVEERSARDMRAGGPPPGSLDGSFRHNGKFATDVAGKPDHGRAVLVLPDGKILVAGKTLLNSDADFLLIQYATDGRRDGNFGVDGIVNDDLPTLRYEGKSLAAQGDGKIVLAGIATQPSNGNGKFAVARYGSDGQLDAANPGFGTSGIATANFTNGNDEGKSVVIQQLPPQQGRIVVAGQASQDFALVGFDTNGGIDTSFGKAGMVKKDVGGKQEPDEANAVVRQADDRLVVAGYAGPSKAEDFALVRYLADGSDTDSTFNNTGIVRTSIGKSDKAFALALAPNDAYIIAAGVTDLECAVVKYDNTGQPLSFANLKTNVVKVPVGEEAECTSVAIDANENIVAAGWTREKGEVSIFVLRLLSNGDVDSSFGKGTGVVTKGKPGGSYQGFAMALQPSDGKIIVVGDADDGGKTAPDVAVLRFND